MSAVITGTSFVDLPVLRSLFYGDIFHLTHRKDYNMVSETEETIRRHIGTVDSLEAARYMVENDHGSYKDSEGNIYYLECEPSDELFYSFAKIEYGDTVEYYDCYVPGKKTRYGRRFN